MNLQRKEFYMAKETLKAKIERLEIENLDLRNKNNDLHNKLASNLHDLDEQFKASPYYKQLLEENEVLADSVIRYKKLLNNADDRNKKIDENFQKLKIENELLKEKNKRGAGRKSVFDDKTRSDIIKKRNEGATKKQLAQEYRCSVGLVHKLISESKE